MAFNDVKLGVGSFAAADNHSKNLISCPQSFNLWYLCTLDTCVSYTTCLFVMPQILVCHAPYTRLSCTTSRYWLPKLVSEISLRLWWRYLPDRCRVRPIRRDDIFHCFIEIESEPAHCRHQPVLAPTPSENQ